MLDGSPRPNGNTAVMVKTFKDAAEAKGHRVTSFNVCKMNIKGCLACEYCHSKGKGTGIERVNANATVAQEGSLINPANHQYRKNTFTVYMKICIIKA